jgi:predicted Zn-ribbon and HTH transcriptional regulator
MTNFKYSASVMIIFALTLALIGCVRPPEAEKSAAKAAMETAMSSGADKYAVADLDAAKKMLETANAQMKEKNYRKAKQDYLAAQAAFNKATGAVATGRKLAATEIQTAVATLEEKWKSITTAAIIKIRDKEMKDDWAADEKAFAESLQAAKDMIVMEPAGAKGQVDKLKAIIAKWDTAKPEQQTATEKPSAEAAGTETPKTEATKAEKPKAAVISPAEQKTKVIGNRDSQRYHLFGMKYYNAVKAHHRVEFASEADAIKAGYHKAPK